MLFKNSYVSLFILTVDLLKTMCRLITRLMNVLYCCRTPEQCPSVVSLLAESYNPHVRYGAAMALGIACAGTGLKVLYTMLTP